VGEQKAGDPARAARAAAIGEFAASLRELRRAAGEPSFREMAGRSRAISHTTLHEAAQGNRLPSWATTVEFIRACGADPAEYRAHWERVRRRASEGWTEESTNSERVRRRASDGWTEESTNSERVRRRASDGWTEESTSEARSDEGSRRVSEPSNRAGSTGRRVALIAVGAAIVLAAGIVAAVVASSGDDSPRHHPGSSAATHAPAPSASDCPIHQTNPPPAPPAHSGDASAFVADLTLPDCSHVQRDQTVTKIWRLKNAGTVTWSGYYLHRLGSPQSRDECQTVSDVPIRTTAPGKTVDVRVEVLTPPVPAFCFVRFKMMDAAGRVVFPGHRPVNFQLVVE